AEATIDVEVKNLFFLWVDKINGYVGEYVSFLAIIAVFVYYYEVLVRYLFNSPTNWAHESMFLMFGMQYMLAAGFTHRENAHVHVDVLYHYFPLRMKALVNVLTSIFFFIFCIVLFWTGWVFAADSIGVWEVSFTEWAIQYWPVKLTLSAGALLLMLDGITKLTKDLIVLFGKRV
ncbi:MAG: TRAP transporter small permease subunit, partial [Deltaproteobacteria bacterium]|nr:TRAP transporter small permease subunit [Deltaproteobacteria bacterium]